MGKTRTKKVAAEAARGNESPVEGHRVGEPDWYRWVVRVLPLLVVAVVFGQTVGFEFINYDDSVNVYANPIFSDLSPGALGHFWFASYEGLYIPLTYSLWALLVKISSLMPQTGQPLNPHLFHAANVLVHGLNTLVLAALLRRLLRHEWAALGGALLFALHPVQVETVAWVSSMKDLLSGFFSLLALWHFVIFCQEKETKGRARRYTMALLCFGGALLAKPGAVVVPLLAMVIGLFVLRIPPQRLAIMLGPWVVMAVPVVVVTKFSQPETQAIFVPPLWQRLLVAGDAVSFYAGKLFFPWTLSPDYGRTPQLVVGQVWMYLTGVLPWIIGGAIIFWRCRNPWVRSSLMLFVAAILPVSGILPFSYQAMSTVADRYLYLAMLGPACLAGRMLSDFHGRRLVTWGFAALLGVLVARSLFQLSPWHDSRSFNSYVLGQNPRSWTAATNLGVVMMEARQPQQAITLYEKALELNPRYVTAYYNLGVARAELRENDQAAAAYQKAIETGPYFFLSYNNLCNLYLAMGRGDDAVRVFQQAVSVFVDPALDPELAGAIDNTVQPVISADSTTRALLYNIAGRLALEMNKAEAAIKYLTRATAINPRLAEAFNNLGNAYAELGQGEEAIAAYSHVIELLPDAADPYNNLCLLYNSLNRGREAVAACQQAISRDPGFAEAYFNMGNALHLLERNQDSVGAYRKALELDPGHVWAAFNAAGVYELLHDTVEAMAFYRQAIQIQPELAVAHLNLSRILLGRGDKEAAAKMYLKAKDLGMSDPMLEGVLSPASVLPQP